MNDDLLSYGIYSFLEEESLSLILNSFLLRGGPFVFLDLIDLRRSSKIYTF